MQDDELNSLDEAIEPKGRLRNLTPAQLLAREAKLAKEAEELRSSLAGGVLTTLKAKVAWILHEFPHTRDSDVSLTLKYWEQYQPNIYNASGMAPKDLFRLERFTHIARVRAKIQNEYKLFPASERVKKHRRKIEETVKDEVLEDQAGRKLLYVFADETGKNAQFVCVAAVWVMTGRSVYELTKSIWEWKERSKFSNKEIHFAELRKSDLDAIRELIELIVAKRELLSIKVISIEKSSTSRPIEEVVRRLHEFMIIRGAEHELTSGRISLPHEIGLTVDAEYSLDAIACADMKSNISAAFKIAHDSKLTIEEVNAADSQKSAMLQLADLVAGSVNRRKNHQGERGVKDDIADIVIESLGIQLEAGEIPGVDATAWLSV